MKPQLQVATFLPRGVSIELMSGMGFWLSSSIGEMFFKQCCCSVAQLTLCDHVDCSQASRSITISQSLRKLKSIESVMPPNHLMLCFPFLPPSVFLSIKVSSNESVLHIRWPKYWSLSFSISPFNEHSGLISFRIDWFVQGTFKSLLQHHSTKASILQYLAFFIVQLSHSHMTTGKIIALTRWTFVGKVNVSMF